MHLASGNIHEQLFKTFFFKKANDLNCKQRYQKPKHMFQNHLMISSRKKCKEMLKVVKNKEALLYTNKRKISIKLENFLVYS